MRRHAATVRLIARARREARFPYAPPEEIALARRRNVRAAIAEARDVPRVRAALAAAGAEPEDVRDAADLARLPPIGPEDLQADPEGFASPRHRAALVLRSTGSTGEPRSVGHDAEALLANAAHGERERSIVAALLGRRRGYREAVIAAPISAVEEVQSFLRARTALPAAFRVKREYVSLLEEPPAMIDRLVAFRPHVLHGIGSVVAAVFDELERSGRTIPGLEVVTYSSDALPDAARATIEGAFGLPVLGTYQTVEALKIGFECGAGPWLHVNDDLYPLRIVDDDGGDVAAGIVGSVVVSNLVNRATPLFQYRLGDRAALLAGPCQCGRSLPRMTRPLGREDEWIARPDGGRLHFMAVRTLFPDEPDVREYQVVQEGPERFAVVVVPAPGADRARLAARIGEKFAARLGAGTEVDVTWAEAIPRGPGGKARTFVRRWG